MMRSIHASCRMRTLTRLSTNFVRMPSMMRAHNTTAIEGTAPHLLSFEKLREANHAYSTILTSLNEHFPDLRVADSDGSTLLHYAAKKLHFKRLVSLVPPNIVNQRDNKGKTALHYAACQDDPLLVPALIDMGADCQIVDNGGSTPLLRCCEEAKYLKPFCALVMMTKDINVTNNAGENALHLVSKSYLNVVYCTDKDFEDKEEAIDQIKQADKSDDIIHSEDDDKHIPNWRIPLQMATVLLKLGLDINTRSNDGSTALHNAVKVGNILMVKLLLKYGADINAVNNAAKKPLHCALNDKKIFNCLHRHGANLNDASGRFPAVYSILNTQFSYPEDVRDALYKDWVKAMETKRLR